MTTTLSDHWEKIIKKYKVLMLLDNFRLVHWKCMLALPSEDLLTNHNSHIGVEKFTWLLKAPNRNVPFFPQRCIQSRNDYRS